MAKTLSSVTEALKKAVKSDIGNQLVKSLVKAGLYKSNNNSSNISVLEQTPKYKEYDTRDDATLRQEAKSYADGLYNNKIDDINAKADKKVNTLNNKLMTAELEKQKDDTALTAEYNADALKITDDAVRKGMLNSSVYTGLMQEAQDEYAGKQQYLASTYAIKRDTIIGEMAWVEEQRKISLQEYDLKKAAEYDKRLSELRKQQQENNEKIAEYNARLREWEEKYEENKKRTLEEWQRAIEEGNA